jgi:hypothetical protein
MSVPPIYTVLDGPFVSIGVEHLKFVRTRMAAEVYQHSPICSDEQALALTRALDQLALKWAGRHRSRRVQPPGRPTSSACRRLSTSSSMAGVGRRC